MPSNVDDQIMLCGTTIDVGDDVVAKLLDVSDLGATRQTVDADYSGATWIERLFSCLLALKPFTALIAFDPNKDWKAAIEAAPDTVTITWAIPGGYTTAATIAFNAGITDFTIRGSNQGRVIASVQITPSGAPTITPGTPVA